MTRLGGLGPRGLVTAVDGRPWSSGAARYASLAEEAGHRYVVGVACRIGSLPRQVALLDTGAQWSVVPGEVAQCCPEVSGVGLDEVLIDTRLGSYRGRLRRLPIALVAEQGADLLVEATALVCDWPGPVVLGYCGFLERVRLGLDPAIEPGPDWLYFGAAGGSHPGSARAVNRP